MEEGSLAALLNLGGPRVELKTDHRAATTGNVFVEYRQPSGLSGISTTEAEWWTFNLVGLGYFIVETARLKALVKLAHSQGRVRWGGDGNRYRGVLVPVEWLVRPFKQAA